MKISWRGGSTIELKSSGSVAVLNSQEKKEDITGLSTLVFDRTQKKLPELEEVVSVDWPGEYDVSEFAYKGVEIHGKESSTIAYVFHFREGNVAWMGELAEYPDAKAIEALGDVHVLILPVGGGDVLKAKDAFRLVEALEPVVVIPMCYGDERDGLSAFIKEMDVKLPEEQKSFDFKRSSLSGDTMELVLLKS
ncbi:MAG: MBL fold metallo-hydrolase [Candidatus Gracilibacteria bacterium]|nr:MBL fold metallo-hydrolase [Candidatus Gracilibacteria bacterium]